LLALLGMGARHFTKPAPGSAVRLFGRFWDWLLAASLIIPKLVLVLVLLLLVFAVIGTASRKFAELHHTRRKIERAA
jgi:hypothetical protein